MPSNYWLSKVRRSIVAAVNADLTLRSLMGRSTNLCIVWRALASALATEDGLPVIVYQIIDPSETDEEGQTWALGVRFTIWADGNDSLDLAEQIAGQLQDVITTNILQANGAGDVGVGNVWRNPVVDAAGQQDSVDANRILVRVDLEVDLNVWVST